MAEGHQVDKSWMWVPSFSEDRTDTAGLLVLFRTTFNLDTEPPRSLRLQVTADTRYKLYVNRNLVGFGPVKGDAALWFYDDLDIAPYLQEGTNTILIAVLRFFYSSQHATSFPRLPLGGCRVASGDDGDVLPDFLHSRAWEAAIDHNTVFRTDELEDDFLHVYQASKRHGTCLPLTWGPVVCHEFQTSTGNAPPWNLSPRLIPAMRQKDIGFSAIHNLQSSVSMGKWENVLLRPASDRETLTLPPDTSHRFDLEVPYHTTALVRFRFLRPERDGSTLSAKYAESYEDTPRLVPYLRTKSQRQDTTKSLYGPMDYYRFRGGVETEWDQEDGEEAFAPFHFRTFRFLQITISVGATPLTLKSFDVQAVNYPLEVHAKVDAGEADNRLWETSVRTLENCMHDCYEDCPFYEQLQYAMDTRTSCLFTYYTTGDDRLARQAIIQLHNSFQPAIGLTASRAPSHNSQVIPGFSLFWVCIVFDHLQFYGDITFSSRFMPVVDAVLNYFQTRIGNHGLVVSEFRPGIWNFTDWAEEWRPYGIPPSVDRTGISTFTNNLYAYTLQVAAPHLANLGRPGLAEEYLGRAGAVVKALREHCFDGQFFTDSLASGAITKQDYSQHNQVWSVLSGAVDENERAAIMRGAFAQIPARRFVPTSIAMAYYCLRALSRAGDDVYNEHFHRFWDPWRAQLALGLTTWEAWFASGRIFAPQPSGLTSITCWSLTAALCLALLAPLASMRASAEGSSWPVAGEVTHETNLGRGALLAGDAAGSGWAPPSVTGSSVPSPADGSCAGVVSGSVMPVVVPDAAPVERVARLLDKRCK